MRNQFVQATETLIPLAQDLLNQLISDLVPVQGGGNNRMFRVITQDGRFFAMKCYLRQSNDSRDRLGTETNALRFLHANGLGKMVPAVLAHNPEQGCAILEWIAGNPVLEPTATDIDSALILIARLKDLAKLPEAIDWPLASEACLSGQEVVRQIRFRCSQLEKESPGSQGLSTFLEGQFAMALEKFFGQAINVFTSTGMDFNANLPLSLQTLSSSDFGFHNTRRQSDGQLVFLDFEYFGRDDPVKLAADFLLHPGMDLALNLKRRFVQGITDIFMEDQTFQTRLGALLPLYGLRWCMILLNEFLPGRWERRKFAKGQVEREKTQTCQLAKANRLLEWLLAEDQLYYHKLYFSGTCT